MASDAICNSGKEEMSWRIEIDRLLDKTDLVRLNQIAISIYHVPRSLSSANPEAFSPQLIAIGPYNHLRSELYCMEKFKILCAKRVLNHFHEQLDLKQLLQVVGPIGPKVRACYHDYLDFDDRTLLYIMAIDGLFLLDLLQTYLKQEHRSLFKEFAPLEAFANDHKLTNDAITRDAIMLENQIPFRTLKNILGALQSFKNGDGNLGVDVREELGHMLLSFCQEHCPLEIWQIPTPWKALKHFHLLGLIYHLILPEDNNTQHFSVKQDLTQNSKPHAELSQFRRYCSQIGSKTKYLGAVLKTPLKWTMDFLGNLKNINLPFIKSFQKPIEEAQSLYDFQLGSATTSETKPPMKIAIPSVSELQKVNVRFQPAKCGITSIDFDKKKCIFYLPVIRLDVNSEVILRNLVAYEALTKTGSFRFTRYTELMRAIIDTVEDVQVLRKAKIISKDSTLSDKECEKLFDGMSKSLRPTKTPKLEEAIKRVNEYYNHTRKIRVQRLLKKYVYSSWKLFTLLATLVLLVLTALQAFCSTYDCPRLLKTSGVSS